MYDAKKQNKAQFFLDFKESGKYFFFIVKLVLNLVCKVYTGLKFKKKILENMILKEDFWPHYVNGMTPKIMPLAFQR